MDILLFGDQAVDVYPFLHRIFFQRGHTTLVTSFLNHVTTALRADISKLPRLQRQNIPPLNNLLEFLEIYHRSQRRAAPIENALLCVAQLAHFIGLAEECPNLLSEEKYMIGLCTGLLAASAASTFSSPASFIPLAVATVRIAFRIGVHVDSVADRLRTRGDGVESWSLIVSGITDVVARNALADFHSETCIPSPKHAYISAVSPSGVTVSGPPETLGKLFETSDCFQNSRFLKTHIVGPYHASHLHDDAAIKDILSMDDENTKACLASAEPQVPILSASSGTIYAATTMIGLLERVVADILVNPIDFNMILQECVSKMSMIEGECRVVPIGPTNAASTVVSALQTRTKTKTSLLDHQFRQSPPGNLGTGSLRNSKIAIVGMSGRFPGGSDAEGLWEVLMKGLDMHKEVPPDRFDAQAHFDPTGKGKNTSHTPFGCFIDNAGLFDPRFFNMSPREAAQTDPMQRLALLTAFEALEMSGYVPNRTPSTHLDRIGTFYGQTSDDWREINEAQDIDTYFITGGVRAFGPGRINYHFKFSGPSFSVDTACSSSMAAIQLACTSLWAGDCDTAVAGGTNVMTNPDIFSGLSKGQFLGKVGPCQTFDNDADGYCRGDGIGTVILKRMEDAEADHDNILGVILSSATNHSADAISITHPHGKTQEILYKKVLDQAGVDPLDVSVVEMHGTGTQAGDGTEMKSVTNVFAPAHRKRRPDQKLYLGSVKANIGHGEAVSGVSALIKSLLMLRHNSIPPHVGIKKEMNKGFPKDFAERNVHIVFKPTTLEASSTPRRIFVNNFSAAGGNTATLIEDAPLKRTIGRDPRPVHVVSTSARALSSLKGNLQNLVGYLHESPNVCLSSLSYTTTARRIHHNYRISVVAADVPQLTAALAKAAEVDTEPTSSAPTVAFAFTGQGSHYAALGANLFETSKQFRTDMIDFDSVAISLGFPSFLPLITGEVEDVSSLTPTLVQVGLTCIQMALTRLWTAWGVKPDVVIGHSLGEYAALNAAGVLSISDTIYLVGERARLLETQCTAGSHAMLAVKAGVSALTDILRDGKIEVACVNSVTETVLSGKTSDIEIAKAALDERGLKGTKLNVPYAFHSSQVEAILQDFERIASSVTFNIPTTPLLSPLLRSTLSIGGIDAKYLCRHAREAVNFVGALSAGREASLVGEKTVFVEIGPHPVCLGFVKATLGASVSTGASLRRNEPVWTSLASTASLLYNKGVDIDWNEYHRDFNDAHELLELPAYSFALKNYWLQYVNNWCLTKGDAPAMKTIAVPIPSLSTTTVQNIVHEEYADGKGTLVAESDINRPDLYAVVSGHLVNGAALCPSSIYGDIGFTIAEHMYRKMGHLPADAPVPGINVRDVEVPRSLIAKPGAPQILKITANADKSRNRIDVSFTTGTTEHCKCVVEYGDKAAWLSEWSRAAHLVEGRMDALQIQAQEHKAHVLLQGMAYKLFASFVDYEETFRGMQRIVMDANNLEASAQIVPQPVKEGQNFACAPYWIDSVGHLSGFIMNANDTLDAKTQVYVSHGWESMRFAEALVPGKEYRTYVRMLPAEGKMVAGDVYLFNGNKIIGLFGGVLFQCIPRRVLDTLLPPAGAVPQRATPTKKQLEMTTMAVTTEKTPTSTVTLKVEQKLSVSKSVTISVMEIIADECGVDMSELADGNSLADMGCDSLMQLAISGRMREDLELDVHSTLFTDYPTIGSLKGYLSTLEPLSDDSDMSESSSPRSSEFDSDQIGSGGSSSKTPGSSPKTPGSPLGHKDAYAHAEVVRALETAASHGMPIEVDHISEKLAMDVGIKEIPSLVLPPKPRFASSVILQGNPKTATKNFFLVPDGGGSATSYVGIPNISPDVCVVGLNSPYMKTPEEYVCGVPGMAEHFIKEIKRRQPQGPYIVGGWSAGGVIAFESAQQLIRAGDCVERLVLIDAPCPLIIEPLPISLHRWFNEIGLLGDPDSGAKKIPPWLLPHFQSSINALSTYSARQIDAAKAPKTFAIWCEDGVCKLPTDPRPEPYPYGHAQWLLENRTDFGPNLWDAMVGKGNVVCSHVEGNHFSMMKAPNVQRLGEEIRKALLCEI
ncbi:hypothetical protein MMC15_005962 [Xylographa vitiligo]|nr:hypothetical protein [Xylographa vitiligo]